MGLLSVGTVTVVAIVDGRIRDVRLSKIESVAIRAERHGTVDWGKTRERGGTVWRVQRRDVRSSRAYHRGRIAVRDQRRRVTSVHWRRIHYTDHFRASWAS